MNNSAPKQTKKLNSLDEVDPEMRRTFEKLGISLEEQKRLSGVAVDAVFDSVSVATTFKGKLAGQIVMISPKRDLAMVTAPMGTRYNDAELNDRLTALLANATKNAGDRRQVCRLAMKR